MTVAENMNDAAVLLHVGHITGLPVYQIATDVSPLATVWEHIVDVHTCTAYRVGGDTVVFKAKFAAHVEVSVVLIL